MAHGDTQNSSAQQNSAVNLCTWKRLCLVRSWILFSLILITCKGMCLVRRRMQAASTSAHDRGHHNHTLNLILCT